ncbi:MAG TPA: DeoR/GlpR family DNA-binding transcription regulator [Deinococcales bacterium]|nr:DeoR/GlpR family DNA-binding transcription regulator [Deinococcales bacterium]
MEERFLSEERRRAILEAIRREGTVRTRDVMTRFGVSDMTVRRDLESLEGAGLLVRTRGGAVAASEASHPYQPYSVRARRQEAEKAAIAQAAAGLVQPGMTVALNAGTTTTEIARLIRQLRVTVVTNSLSIAREAHDPAGATVLVTGGVYRPGGEALVGEWTHQNLEGVFADVAFIGFSGLKNSSSFAVVDPDEAAASRRLLRTARRVVMVADSSKFARPAASPVAPFAAAHVVISDAALAPRLRELLENQGVELITATPKPETATRRSRE